MWVRRTVINVVPEPPRDPRRLHPSYTEWSLRGSRGGSHTSIKTTDEHRFPSVHEAIRNALAQCWDEGIVLPVGATR